MSGSVITVERYCPICEVVTPHAQYWESEEPNRLDNSCYFCRNWHSEYIDE